MKLARKILVNRSLSEILRRKCLPKKVADAFEVTAEDAADNAVGYAVETWLREAGYLLNSGAGPDIPELEVEIKTRKVQSHAPWTIGAVAIDDLTNINPRYLPILSKLRIQMHVLWCADTEKILDVEILNFADQNVQHRFIEAFEELKCTAIKKLDSRKLVTSPAFEIISAPKWKLPKSIKCSGVGYLELKSGNTYQFRIRPKDMDSIKTMVKTKSTKHLLENYND